MKSNAKQATVKKIFSWFLSLCMVLSLISVNAITAEAAATEVSDENPYQLGGKVLPIDGEVTAEETGGKWSWDGENKVLTFMKHTDIDLGAALENDVKYRKVALGLPAGSKIVLEPGVLVTLNAHFADAIFCEGDLTICGDGALAVNGSITGVSTEDTGYANDNGEIGSAIRCHGKLTIGSEHGDKTYVIVNSLHQNVAVRVSSDKEVTENETLMEIASGQLSMATKDIIIDCGGKAKVIKMGSLNTTALIYGDAMDDPATNPLYDGFTLEYGYHYQDYYFGGSSKLYMIHYNANGKGRVSKGRQLVSYMEAQARPGYDVKDIAWTGTVMVDKIEGDHTWKFLGWSDQSDATTPLEQFVFPAMGDTETFRTIELYAVYEEVKLQEAKPAPLVDYKNNKLTGLESNADYKIEVLKTGETQPKEYTITSDAEGKISLFGTGYDLSDSTLTIVKLGRDANYLDSEAASVSVVTPKVKIDYVNEKLTDLDANTTYEITVGVDKYSVTTDANGMVDLVASDNSYDLIGENIFIVKMDGDKYVSTRPTISIPDRTATPKEKEDYKLIAGVVDVDAGIKIDFVKNEIAYEISTDGGANWTEVKDSTIVDPNEEVQIRVKATETSFESAVATSNSGNMKEETPEASIRYTDEKFTGLEAGAKYIVRESATGDSKEVTAGADGTVTIDENWFGKNVTIEKVSTQSNVDNSDKQTLNVAARQKAPVEGTDYEVKDAVADVNEGKATVTIIGDDSYEYKVGTGAWTPIAKGATLDADPSETVLIRKAATADKFMSEEATVNLDNTKEGTPDASVSYEEEALTDLVPGDVYEVTDAEGNKITVTADAEGNIALEGKDDSNSDYSLFDTTLSIVKKGENGTSDSDAQADVVVDARPSAPVKDTDYSVTEAVTGVNNGNATITIKDDTKDYEYYDQDTDSWKPITDGKLDVEPETDTMIRVTGDTTTFASEPTTITTAKAKEGKEATPNAIIDYETECLYGLVSGDAYEITYTPDGGAQTTIEVVADADGEIALEDTLEDADETEYCLIGADLSIVKKGVTDGNGDTTQDSDAQSLNVPARPTAPTEDDVVDSITAEGTTITIPNGFIADYYDETIRDEENDEYGVYVEVAPGESVTLPAGTEIEVWKTGDADTFESDVLVFNAIAKEATPNATINYKDSVVEGLATGEKYVVKIGDTVIGEGVANQDGTLDVDLENIVTGTVVSVVKIGDEAEYTVDSDACDITVPTQPSVPNVPIKAENGKNTVTIVEPTDEEGNVTTELEIWDEETDTWVPIGEDGYEVPTETEVFVRVSATEDTPASLTTSITTPTMEKTPNASVDYAGEGLKNLIAGEQYLITTADNVLVVKGAADENGKLAIDNFKSYYGKDLLVTKLGKDGTNGTITSAAQTVTVKDSSTVTAPSKGQFTVINGTETTTITGITSDQEYSTDGGNTWHTGDGKDVVIPAGTTILIRDKATEDTPASEPLEIKTEALKTQETTPNASVDYAKEKITGLVANTDYVITVDGVTSTVKSDANGMIDLNNYFGKTITIVKPGNGTTTTDSAAQQITVASKASTPSADQFVVETPASGDTGTVVIKNVTGDYEYSLDNGAVWLPGTGADLTVPAGTTVLIRRKATTTTPASDSVKIIATTYISSTIIEQAILNTNTDKKDPEGATFGTLRLKATGKNKAIKLNWKKVPDADGYIIYGSACGSKMKRITTITGASKKSWTQKKLKKGKYYKYIVSAYKIIDGKEYIIATSISAHAITNGSKKWGNPIKVKVTDSKLTVKKNKTKKIKASYTYKKKVKKHIAILRYESSNPKVATVTKKGKVKGISKGKATIYVYAQNGVYKTVKVTVK